jgi:hypothetical protein
MSYDGSATRRATVDVKNNPLASARSQSPMPDWPKRPDGSPDFDQMNPAQRHSYHQARLNRTLR